MSLLALLAACSGPAHPSRGQGSIEPMDSGDSGSADTGDLVDSGAGETADTAASETADTDIWDTTTDTSVDVDVESGADFVRGLLPRDSLGAVVAGGGDCDGDGVPDVFLMSESAWDEPERGWLFSGPVVGANSPHDADVSFVLDSWDGYSCYTGCAGILADVNGDGLADLVTGGMLSDREGEEVYPGAARVYYAPLEPEERLDAEDATLWGESAYDFAGATLAGVGDTNGDGFDDFLVGAPGDATGWAYLIEGPVAGESSLVDVAAAIRGIYTDGDRVPCSPQGATAMETVSPTSRWVPTVARKTSTCSKGPSRGSSVPETRTRRCGWCSSPQRPETSMGMAGTMSRWDSGIWTR